MTTRPCLDCGRPVTGKHNRCTPCRSRHNRRRDQRRGSANNRGYGHKWRATSRPVWQGKACVYCGAPAQGADHVVPKSHNGSDGTSNLVPACTSCNSAKRDRIGWGPRGAPPARKPEPPT